MEEKTLKTSWKQRVAIIIVAVLLLGSVVLTYMLVVLNGNSSSDTSSEAQIAELTEEYQQKSEEIEAAAKPLSDKYFDDFVKYKSEVKSYNSANANAAGLETKDLKEGTGRTLTDTGNSASIILSRGVLCCTMKSGICIRCSENSTVQKATGFRIKSVTLHGSATDSTRHFWLRKSGTGNFKI